MFSSLELCPKANHVIDLYPVDEVPLGFSVDVVEKNIYGKFTPSFVVSQVIRGKSLLYLQLAILCTVLANPQ